VRYRILGVFAAVMTVFGLAAPAASASSQSTPPGTGWTLVSEAPQSCNPCHLMANVDHSLGITYPGTGEQATVTTSPGSSTVEFVTNTKVLIHNNNGNCLEMRDAANGHAVMEESGCDSTNAAQQFNEYDNGAGTLYAFNSVDYGNYWLGVSCTPHGGSPLWGVTDASGTCFNWVQQ
jgi:hypothetical protein